MTNWIHGTVSVLTGMALMLTVASCGDDAGLNIAKFCEDGCSQEEACGGLEDGMTLESCIAACDAEASAFLAMVSPECETRYAALAACTTSLSCEDLAIYTDPSALGLEDSWPCYQEEMQLCDADPSSTPATQ